MSRCSSPMPLRMVWPDSRSVETRNDGSSAASFASATPSFSWSAFDFGSIAISITGSGDFLFFDLQIGRDPERRILRGKFCQRDAELFLVGLRLRLDRDFDHRLGEFHLFQD